MNLLPRSRKLSPFTRGRLRAVLRILVVFPNARQLQGIQ